MKSLEESITEAVLIWRSFWSPPSTDLGSIARAWLGVLGPYEVTSEEFEIAANRVASTATFWPKPNDMISILKDIREERWSDRVRDYAECMDENGHLLLAPRNCITDGRLDASGNGNGRALPDMQSVPALSVREILDAMTNEEAKTIFIALVGPEAINGGE